MNLIDVHKQLATDDQCLDYLERSRWPHGVRCLTCGGNKISRVTRKSRGKNKRARLFQCLEPTCRQQFTVTSGTIFHDSHLPLTKWFMAVALIVDAKKGMAANQLKRHLRVNYRTAWYLAHRIREAMEDAAAPKLKGTVEIDETYIGGKARGRGIKWGKDNKDVVLGIRERKGPLRLVKIADNKKATLYEAISKHVDRNAERIMTDEWPAYNFKLTQYHRVPHQTVRHIANEYVRGDVHTNTIESAFSLLKRAVIGTYHQLSIKHLQRYLNEFGYRFSRRDMENLFGETVRRMVRGAPIQYKRLTAGASVSAS